MAVNPMIALVVEREWDDKESLKKKLERRGYEVHTAENAEEALNLSTVLDVDLVITSSDLPEMSGFALIERIAEGRKDLSISSVILLERNESPQNALRNRVGSLSFINKPVLEESLSKCLDPETEDVEVEA